MNTPKVPAKAIKRIWGDDGYRLFLSHTSQVKKQVATLQKQLKVYGVSAFVAHANIRPTLEWQGEIENALHSMHALAALMTEDFHESNWTDQEVGFALGLRVPIISLRLGRTPYGFLAKVQALSCNWDNAAERIVKLLIRYKGMVDSYLQAIRYCEGSNNANLLARILPSIEELDDHQIEELVDTYNSNYEVNHSFGFNGDQSYRYGLGLIPHLHRLGSRKYEMYGDHHHIRRALKRNRRV